MSTSIADERRLLTEDEYQKVVRSHYPALLEVARNELPGLARWLRDQRARMRGMIEHRRRVRRGKAEPRSAAVETSSERGVAAKKQVFARALKRVNARLDHLRAEEKRAEIRVRLGAALERKRKARIHHPSTGRRAGKGMRPIENPKGPDVLEPTAVGRVSQAVRRSQAHRDNKVQSAGE
ncbi:hypothetical protein [Reyranella sp.]|jgi:hypothetical protein|uniref:hypothetical protein n=1 Tax=Reyranella sp. TaxID=1929291 RepID=UPI002F930453